MNRNHTKSSAFASIYGSAGTRLRIAGLINATWPTIIAFALFGYLLRAAFPYPELAKQTTGLLMLILAILCFVAVVISQKRLAAFLKGAHGEEQVAHELAFLPDTYSVFHGIPATSRHRSSSGGHDYDHIVIGPTGVFVLETKNWQALVTVEQGEVLYDGNRPSRSPIEQAQQAAHAVADFFPVPRPTVHPIVCFTGESYNSSPQILTGVILCNVRDLVTLLKNSFETPLNAEERNQLAVHLQKRLYP